MNMTKEEALNRIAELQKYIEELDQEEVDDGLFLLSEKEFQALRKNINGEAGVWWLRTKGTASTEDNDLVMAVTSQQMLISGGERPEYCYGIRAAFKIDEKTWDQMHVVYAYDMVFDYIGKYNGCVYFLSRYCYKFMPFGDSNDYKDSAVREFLQIQFEGEDAYYAGLYEE